MSRLEEIALEYGLCNCDEAYTKRNLTAPDCPFHAFAVSEAMEQYAREVAQLLWKERAICQSIYMMMNGILRN